MHELKSGTNSRDLGKNLHSHRVQILVLAVVVLGWFVFLLYRSLIHTHGHFSGLIDDVYIHFQYAKMLAKGDFFQYCPGCGFSKGATSFLYPILLAPGWLIGFRGEYLLLWALVLAYVSVVGLLYLLVDSASRMGNRTVGWIAVALVLLNGEFLAGSASGMEVAIASFAFALWANLLIRNFLDSNASTTKWALLLVSAIMPLVRPELIVGSGMTALFFVWESIRQRDARRLWFVLVPFLGQASLMVLLYAKTGSFATNSMLSKSYLYQPGITLHKLISITFNNYRKFWVDVLMGMGKKEPYFVPLFGLLSMFGSVVLLVHGVLSRHTKAVLAGVFIALAVVFGLLIPQLTYSVSWGLYRYCMPFYPWLILPVAALVVYLFEHARALGKVVSALLIVYLVQFAISTNIPRYVHVYEEGTTNIYTQHRRMGEYINKHLPKRAIIGINDAGAIAYFSERRTFDLLGLTTEGMALCFRNGMGCVYETFKHMDRSKRPTHFAVYRSWWFNRFIMGKVLFSTSTQSRIMVGGYIKRLYVADWSKVDLPDLPKDVPSGMVLVDEFDIGSDLTAKAHTWQVSKNGKNVFVKTVYHEYRYAGDRTGRVYPEGGKVIPRGVVETFVMKTPYSAAATLVMRTDAYFGVNIAVWTNKNSKRIKIAHKRVGKAWTDVVIPLNESYISAGTTRIFIQSMGKKDYAPFHYWLYLEPQTE